MPKSTGMFRHHHPHKKWPKDKKVRAILKEFRADAVAYKKKYGKRTKYQTISKQAFERETKRKGCRYVGSDEGGSAFLCEDRRYYRDDVNNKYLRQKFTKKQIRKWARQDRHYSDK